MIFRSMRSTKLLLVPEICMTLEGNCVVHVQVVILKHRDDRNTRYHQYQTS